MLPPWRLANLPSDKTVLLGLSGGADSRVLLHLLSAFARRDGFEMVVAHVNHGIRGDEAERDALFCQQLASEYGWEFLRLDTDVPTLAKQHRRSLELEAREVRYAFFEKIMKERKIEILVTAHHADDNLETVLFRICRGTGLHGLVGIPAVRKFSEGVLVRPLLPYSRREILAFCKEESLEFVTDSTNEKKGCSRNQIRLDVVPALEKFFESPQSSVYRMTRILEDDLDYLNREAEAFLQEHLRADGISAEVLQGAHPAIRRRVIGKMLPKTLETIHLTAIETLLEKGDSGASMSLPGDLCACLQNGRLLILSDLRLTASYERFPCEIGEVSLCDGKLTVSVKTYEKCKSEPNVHNAYTSSCIILKGTGMDELYFRGRRSGDAMPRKGVRRQIRRLYREAGVPVAVRDALPLLCQGENVLWAPFVGYADGVAPSHVQAEDWVITVRVRILNEMEKEGTLSE